MPLLQERYYTYDDGNWSRNTLWAIIAVPVVAVVLITMLWLRRKQNQRSKASESNNSYYQTQLTSYQPPANYPPNIQQITYQPNTNMSYRYDVTDELPAYLLPPGQPPAKPMNTYQI